MSDTPELAKKQENWGSKLGVVLAVAGSAVGLGNFLRFPGQAVNNGGGAFMIPYIISFLVVGVPIAWCEWTMGRLGGRYMQNSAPGILYALWRRWPAKAVGAMALLIPIGIYMYYVVLEAWCLDYCIEFARGGFGEMFTAATAEVAGHAAEVDAIVGQTGAHFADNVGFNEHGALFAGGRMVWLVLICFIVNFFVIYHGVTRGIELFCKWAMPLLIACAVVILVRVLTLPNISSGLGFMWNPNWQKLTDWEVWIAASGQIFFSLSVGFGLILCYSSYLRNEDDVALTALSASSANEFCEVILGGLIVVPTAFLFLGADNASQGTFGLGFVTVPAIMHFMPGGHFFGALWFGLLFLAGITSSLSMIQPAIAFLEDAFGLTRRGSCTLLAVATAIGATTVMYFSRNLIAMDHTDFWCNFLMIVAATAQVLIFGWIIGAKRGVKEMNRGADFKVPKLLAPMVRYVTPTFLIVILVGWTYQNLPGYLDGMNPELQRLAAERGAYVAAITEHFTDDELSEEALAARVEGIVGPDGEDIVLTGLPEWLKAETIAVETNGARRQITVTEHAKALAAIAAEDANVARFVFIGLIILLLLLVMLSDLACRNRMGKLIQQAERNGIDWEASG